ncbi:MAG: outer membrane lipoprotein-sorting protein [Kiritimatiellae bacterium]|nr:outer membrane lipoprotein-sorting protein [Kiritimatiellia bacterium]
MKTVALICLSLTLAGALEAIAGDDTDPPPSPTTNLSVEAEAELPPEELPPPASAGELMQAMLGRLPAEPLTLTGTLTVRRQRGVVLREVPFAMRLHWGDTPPRAEYELRDNFGRVVERMTVQRRADGDVTTRWSGPDGLDATNPPALTAAVRDTDITWLDLTLAFLWWQDARLDGEEEFRGSRCDKVIVTPPAPIPGCAAMRLWVDRRLRFIRQVEQLNSRGERVRRMWVSSIAKTGDRWMIRNMEIERPGTGQRTKLHVANLGGA